MGALVRYALAGGEAADAHPAAVLEGYPSWTVPAALHMDLFQLSLCPGADAGGLLARRERVIEAMSGGEGREESEPRPQTDVPPRGPPSDPAQTSEDSEPTSPAPPPANPRHPADAAESP